MYRLCVFTSSPVTLGKMNLKIKIVSPITTLTACWADAMVAMEMPTLIIKTATYLDIGYLYQYTPGVEMIVWCLGVELHVHVL